MRLRYTESSATRKISKATKWRGLCPVFVSRSYSLANCFFFFLHIIVLRCINFKVCLLSPSWIWCHYLCRFADVVAVVLVLFFSLSPFSSQFFHIEFLCVSLSSCESQLTERNEMSQQIRARRVKKKQDFCAHSEYHQNCEHIKHTFDWWCDVLCWCNWLNDSIPLLCISLVAGMKRLVAATNDDDEKTMIKFTTRKRPRRRRAIVEKYAQSDSIKRLHKQSFCQ